MELTAAVLPALGEAFALIFSPAQIGWLAVGVLLGLSVGIFPGLGGIAGLSLVLPFIYGMDPVSGLAMMVGLVAVIPTSDTFASVLMGIPGSSASQATVLDGFPLARAGQAARALAAAFASSLFGGLFGAAFLTFFIVAARPVVLAFGFPELLMLTVLGLSMVGVLAGRSLLKGLLAAGLGLAIGAIGEAPAQGSPRMDFGRLVPAGRASTRHRRPRRLRRARNRLAAAPGWRDLRDLEAGRGLDGGRDRLVAPQVAVDPLRPRSGSWWA